MLLQLVANKCNSYCHLPWTHWAFMGLGHWQLVSKFCSNFFCFCSSFFWLLFYFKTFKLLGEWGGAVRAKPHSPCICIYVYDRAKYQPVLGQISTSSFLKKKNIFYIEEVKNIIIIFKLIKIYNLCNFLYYNLLSKITTPHPTPPPLIQIIFLYFWKKFSRNVGGGGWSGDFI